MPEAMTVSWLWWLWWPLVGLAGRLCLYSGTPWWGWMRFSEWRETLGWIVRGPIFLALATPRPYEVFDTAAMIKHVAVRFRCSEDVARLRVMVLGATLKALSEKMRKEDVEMIVDRGDGQSSLVEIIFEGRFDELVSVLDSNGLHLEVLDLN